MKPTTAHKAYFQWIMEKPCCVPGCTGRPVVAHHVSRKPVYGTLEKPGPRRDHKWMAELCDGHHVEYHDELGSVEAFEEKYDVNLDEIAQWNFEEYWT